MLVVLAAISAQWQDSTVADKVGTSLVKAAGEAGLTFAPVRPSAPALWWPEAEAAAIPGAAQWRLAATEASLPQLVVAVAGHLVVSLEHSRPVELRESGVDTPLPPRARRSKAAAVWLLEAEGVAGVISAEGQGMPMRVVAGRVGVVLAQRVRSRTV